MMPASPEQAICNDSGSWAHPAKGLVQIDPPLDFTEGLNFLATARETLMEPQPLPQFPYAMCMPFSPLAPPVETKPNQVMSLNDGVTDFVSMPSPLATSSDAVTVGDTLLDNSDLLNLDGEKPADLHYGIQQWINEGLNSHPDPSSVVSTLLQLLEQSENRQQDYSCASNLESRGDRRTAPDYGANNDFVETMEKLPICDDGDGSQFNFVLQQLIEDECDSNKKIPMSNFLATNSSAGPKNRVARAAAVPLEQQNALLEAPLSKGVTKTPRDVNLIVRRIPFSCDEEVLRKIFSKFGTVAQSFIVKHSDTASKRSGFVRMASWEAAQTALEALHNRVVLDSQQGPLQVRYAHTERGRPPAATNVSEARSGNSKLFVGSLPSTTTEAALRVVFEPFGEIDEIFVMKKGQGYCKGCAFVKYVREESANEAIKRLNRSMPSVIGSQAIQVRPAQSGKRAEYSTGPLAMALNSKNTREQPKRGYDGDKQGGLVIPGHSDSSGNDIFSFNGDRAGWQLDDSAFQLWSNSGYTFAPEELPAGNMGLCILPRFTNRGLGPIREILNINGKCRYINVETNEISSQMPPEFLRAYPHLPAVGAGPPGANIFIFHIPNEWDTNDLVQTFALFGHIISARIGTSKQGRTLGYGFVSYSSRASAAVAAVQLNGLRTFNKRLKVKIKTGPGESTDNRPNAAASRSST